MKIAQACGVTAAILLIGSIALKDDACASETASPPLIPRQVYFAQPELRTPLLSPDGKYISAIRPLGGVMNIFVASVDNPRDWRPVTNYTDRDVNPTNVSGTPTMFWTKDSRYIVFLRDHNGDERHHALRVDVKTGEILDLTPGSDVRAVDCTAPVTFLGCIGGAQKDHEVLIGIYGSNPAFYDLYWIDASTGEKHLAFKNDKFITMITDSVFEPRIGIAFENGGVAAYLRGHGEEWKLFENYGPNGPPSRFVNFNATGDKMRLLSSEGRDKQALIELDIKTKARRLFVQDKEADLSDALIKPTTGEIEAYVRNWIRPEYVALDPHVAKSLKALKKVVDGSPTILSRSDDDNLWLVKYTLSDAPESVYLFDRKTEKATKLFTLTPALEKVPLSKMHPLKVRTSDGFTFISYYSLPLALDPRQIGRPSSPAPFVTIIHGGPSDERASWAFSPIGQWLNNRGYGVLFVNFRGSLGFGRKFMDAKNHEWGGKMNRDIDEQVERLIRERIADPKHVGVMGGSYGGFATLTAITKRPDLYTCAVDVVGPANLETFIANRPPEWMLDQLATEVGDPRTPEGVALLKARSPINFVQNVKGPILIVQGSNDRRVPKAESDLMASALDKQGVKVTYLLYSDEGHGLLRAPNTASFAAVAEVFWSGCLGGRAQPIEGPFAGSSLQVPLGAERIPGLVAAASGAPPTK